MQTGKVRCRTLCRATEAEGKTDYSSKPVMAESSETHPDPLMLCDEQIKFS